MLCCQKCGKELRKIDELDNGTEVLICPKCEEKI